MGLKRSPGLEVTTRIAIKIQCRCVKYDELISNNAAKDQHRHREEHGTCGNERKIPKFSAQWIVDSVQQDSGTA